MHSTYHNSKTARMNFDKSFKPATKAAIARARSSARANAFRARSAAKAVRSSYTSKPAIVYATEAFAKATPKTAYRSVSPTQRVANDMHSTSHSSRPYNKLTHARPTPLRATPVRATPATKAVPSSQRYRPETQTTTTKATYTRAVPAALAKATPATNIETASAANFTAATSAVSSILSSRPVVTPATEAFAKAIPIVATK